MVVKIFAVYDIKAEAYMAPFFMPATGQAVRMFKDAVNDKNTQFGKHPEDYKLVQIGEFDDNKGMLHQEDILSLGFGTDYLDKAEVVPLSKIG